MPVLKIHLFSWPEVLLGTSVGNGRSGRAALWGFTAVCNQHCPGTEEKRAAEGKSDSAAGIALHHAADLRGKLELQGHLFVPWSGLNSYPGLLKQERVDSQRCTHRTRLTLNLEASGKCFKQNKKKIPLNKANSQALGTSLNLSHHTPAQVPLISIPTDKFIL